MLKKTLIAVLFILPVSLFAQDLKFGHVDRQELLKSMPDATAAQKTLEDLVLKYKTETQKLETEFQTKYADFQQNSSTLDPAIRSLRENELNKMYENIQSFSTAAQESIQKKQSELMLPIDAKITKAIKLVGEEGGFVYIFDTQSSGLLYFSSKSIDVLPLVKKKLDEMPSAIAAPATSPTPSVAAPAPTAPTKKK
jgi:outer membrane protein